jgi:hypothetical protein
VEWLAPAEAVALAEAGTYLMLPPTVTTLRELARHGSPAEALAAARGRSLVPIMARTELGEDGRVSVSWDGYPELTVGSADV